MNFDITLEQDLANIFWKASGVKYFSLCESVFVVTTQLPQCAAKTFVNNCVKMCTNKTLLRKKRKKRQWSSFGVWASVSLFSMISTAKWCKSALRVLFRV